MIKINLVAEAPQAAASRRKRPQVSLGARQGDIILLSILALAAVITGGHYYILHSKQENLKQIESARRRERDELQVFILKVQELEKKRADLKHKIDVIKGLKDSQQGPVRIMDEVSRALPDLVWLERLNLSGDTLTLVGRAMDENNVANYISNLDASPFFQEPSLKDLARADKDTFRFTLTCVFTYAPKEIAGASGERSGT